MREKKYHIYLTAEEQSRVIQSLIRLKNELLEQGNTQCSFGGRQCDYSGSGSISASKRNDAARADDFKGKEVYQSGY